MTGRPPPDRLARLLAPRSFVVFGGREAEMAIRQSRALGYTGTIWAVHPTRDEIAGVPCLRDLDDLPGVPDAAFVAVSRERALPLVARLARLGVAGVVCHASGYAEDGPEGAEQQRLLVEAAGEMALIGPNCLGLVDYRSGAALWSDQQGGRRVETGVALIAQSGNIAESLTMQRRSLPIAQLVTVGNGASTGVTDLIEAALLDPGITAIGLYLEALPDPHELTRVAAQAMRRRVPIVALKAGTSALGAQVTLTHTSSLAGPDALAQALFDRLSIARVGDLETFLETLKLLHVHGPLAGVRICSSSCSGGEAAMIADLAGAGGLELPAFGPAVADELRDVLSDRVPIRNPLDYHTYIWTDPERLTRCFTALLGAGVDEHLLLLDVPRDDRCDTAEFDVVVDAFIAAQAATGARACVVSTLPEGLPERIGDRLLAAGIAPMQGAATCLRAIRLAARIGTAQAAAPRAVWAHSASPGAAEHGALRQLDEAAAKGVLDALGITVPAGLVTEAPQASEVATGLGYPVVLKAVSDTLTHKTEVGGVRVGLRNEREVEAAAVAMAGLSDRFLIETMVPDTVAELIIGVRREPGFGAVLTVGAGGVLAELVDDTVTLLLPAHRGEIAAALSRLRCWRLLTGYRGAAPADTEPVIDAVARLAAHAVDEPTLVSFEINPLLVGLDAAVAVDAVAHYREPATETAPRLLETQP